MISDRVHEFLESLDSIPSESQLQVTKEFLKSLPQDQHVEVTLLALTRARDRDRHAIILIHGIRTRAEWQDQVRSVFRAQTDITVKPVSYGFYDVLSFLIPLLPRRRIIKRVVGQLRDELYRSKRVSVIAHSNGTYVITQILKKFPDIHLNRLVLCGGIVSLNYPWQAVTPRVGASHKTISIINECGCRDFLPVLASSAGVGYGASGRFGFGDVSVADRFHDCGHSGFLTTSFAEKYWIPFFTKGEILEGVPRTKVNYLLSIADWPPFRFKVILPIATIIYFL